jgi:hypothetical protein
VWRGAPDFQPERSKNIIGKNVIWNLLAMHFLASCRLKSEVGGAHPPRVSLDAPRAHLFSARGRAEGCRCFDLSGALQAPMIRSIAVIYGITDLRGIHRDPSFARGWTALVDGLWYLVTGICIIYFSKKIGVFFCRDLEDEI